MVCMLCLVALTTAAMLEVVRTRQGVSVISRRQFRLRILSALVWDLVLGGTALSMLFLWPTSAHDEQKARGFISVMTGVILLICIGLLLLAYDVALLSRRQAQEERRFTAHLDQFAAAELKRVRRPNGAPLHEFTGDAVEPGAESNGNLK